MQPILWMALMALGSPPLVGFPVGDWTDPRAGACRRALFPSLRRGAAIRRPETNRRLELRPIPFGLDEEAPDPDDPIFEEGDPIEAGFDEEAP